MEGIDTLDPTQIGHDLWLTRNGHGCGFWDLPEVYGEANAALFTRLAKAMGGLDAEFIDDGRPGLGRGSDPVPLHDINGNQVGTTRLTKG